MGDINVVTVFISTVGAAIVAAIGYFGSARKTRVEVQAQVHLAEQKLRDDLTRRLDKCESERERHQVEIGRLNKILASVIQALSLRGIRIRHDDLGNVHVEHPNDLAPKRERRKR